MAIVEKKKPAARAKRRKHSGLQIRDVSRLSGVSAQTISRYFNEPEKVAEKTRARISKVIEQTGYVPNLVAKGLSENRTNIVAAIVPTISHSIFADVLSGLSDALEAENHRLLISNSGYSLAREETLLRELLAQRPAGIVLIGQDHTRQTADLLDRAKVPVVELLEIDQQPIDMCVGFSNYQAVFQLTQGLIARGYENIGFVSVPFEANDRVRRRHAGYADAMAQAGLRIEPGWIRTARFSFREGARAFGELLSDHGDIEVVVSNDILAVGGMLECQRRGIRVPDDLGICGFEDMEITAMLHPPLTTIRIPRYEIGCSAGRLILDRLSGAAPPQGTIDVGFTLIWRGSTK